MSRLPLAALAALLTSALAGCDFTPTLDVPLPEFAPALTINGVLAADSTVEVRITAAADPYGRYRDDGVFDVPEGAVVELLHDGAPAGPLRLASRACEDYSFYTPDQEFPTYECGAFVSDVVVEAGATYTVRASAPGFPPAEATVAVPARVAATVAVGASVEQPIPNGTRLDTDLTVTFQDPPGLGDRYALVVVSGPYSYVWEERGWCVDRTCTEVRDTSYTVFLDRIPLGYTTTDPVLLAGARAVPSSGINFITFTDESFDGAARSFPLRVQQYQYNGPNDRERAPLAGVWLAAVDDRTFGAYQITWFSGGEDNPFAEPADLPSNVVGGYGLLGAVTITEALIDG